MTVPLDERRILDALPIDRESIYRAWRYGQLYGRLEACNAIVGLPSVFGARNDELIICDASDIGPKAIDELRRGDLS